MKKMVTILALLLTVCLVVPCMSNAAELVYDGKYTSATLPVTEEPITISGFGSRFSLHGDWNTMPFFTAWSELTGVTVEWEMVPQDGYQEKKNLKFAAGDIPDLLFRAGITGEDRINYGVDSDGSIGLLALNDLIEEYGANIQAMYEAVPYAKAQATQYNGMIYDLPRVEEASNDRLHIVWINQSWLNNLEMSKPTTIDELLTVLRAFRDEDANGNGDPTDEIPISDFSSSIDRIMMDFMGSFGCGNMGYIGPWNYDYETGTIYFYKNTENWKAFLGFMHTLYEEKLLDADFFTNDSARYSALLAEDRIGIHAQCSTGDAGDNWYKWDVLLPVVGIEGEKPCYGQTGTAVLESGTAAISCTNPYPVETFKMLDFLYSDEGFILQNYGGLEGQTYYIDDNGCFHTTYEDGTYVWEAYNNCEIQYWGECSPYYGGSTPIWNKTNEYKAEMFPNEELSALNYARTQERNKAHELYLNDYVDMDIISGSLNFTADETEALKSFTDDGNSYISEMTMKFITGEASLETDWDTYCQTLDKMGLASFQEIYNTAYARMNAK